MDINYVRTFLDSDESLSKRQKDKLLNRIMHWAERNKVENIDTIHTVLSEWIDEIQHKNRNFVELNRPIGEDISLVDIIGDPRAMTPPEILIMHDNGEKLGTNELRDLVRSSFPALEEVVDILFNDSNVNIMSSSIDLADIHHRFHAILPGVKNKTLLHPGNQIVRLGFDENNDLKIEYRQYCQQKLWIPVVKYDPAQVRRAIELRLGGATYGSIHRDLDVPVNRVGLWMKHAGLGNGANRTSLDLERCFAKFEKSASIGVEGYVDERFQKVIEMRSQGKSYGDIRRETGVGEHIIGLWLRASGITFLRDPSQRKRYPKKPKPTLYEGDSRFRVPMDEYEVLGFVREYYAKTRIGPSSTEICMEFDSSYKCVVRGLVREGGVRTFYLPRARYGDKKMMIFLPDADISSRILAEGWEERKEGIEELCKYWRDVHTQNRELLLSAISSIALAEGITLDQMISGMILFANDLYPKNSYAKIDVPQNVFFRVYSELNNEAKGSLERIPGLQDRRLKPYYQEPFLDVINTLSRARVFNVYDLPCFVAKLRISVRTIQKSMVSIARERFVSNEESEKILGAGNSKLYEMLRNFGILTTCERLYSSKETSVLVS